MPGFIEERKGTSRGTSGEEIGKPPDSREGIGTGKGNRREQGSRRETKVFTSGPKEKGNREPRARLFPRD